MLIDTSMWIEFFRKGGSFALKQRVATLIELDQAAFTCPIHFEILSGAHDSEIGLVKETFALIERHPFRPEFWDQAADLDRRLRKKGVTIPRDDLFIAVAAHRLSLTLVCKDKHFDLIREKTGFALQIEQHA